MTVFFCRSVSTVDFVKKIAKECGWDGIKRPEDRKFLSDLKQLLSDWHNVPNEIVIKEARIFARELKNEDLSDFPAAMFIHCREPENIKELVEELNAKTILITRDSYQEEEISNDSDANVLDYDYDIIIENDGTLDDFKEKALEFARNEGLIL